MRGGKQNAKCHSAFRFNYLLSKNLFSHIHQSSIFLPAEFTHEFIIHNPGFPGVNCMRHTGNLTNSQQQHPQTACQSKAGKTGTA